MVWVGLGGLGDCHVDDANNDEDVYQKEEKDKDGCSDVAEIIVVGAAVCDYEWV